MRQLLILATVFAAFSVFADLPKADVLTCRTADNRFHGFTAVSLISKNGSTFELSGIVSGGIAHFSRQIPPVDVIATYSGDTVTYSNAEQGVKLVIVTTPIGHRLYQTATFQETPQLPGLSMTCTMVPAR